MVYSAATDAVVNTIPVIAAAGMTRRVSKSLGANGSRRRRIVKRRVVRRRRPVARKRTTRKVISRRTTRRR